MKRYLYILIFLVFLSSEANALRVPPQPIEMSPEKTNLTLRVWNDASEQKNYFLSVSSTVIDVNGNMVETTREKKFCNAIVITPRILNKFLPGTYRDINITLEDPNIISCDHVGILLFDLVISRNEQLKTGEATPLECIMLPIHFFSSPSTHMSAKITNIDIPNAKVLIESVNSTSKLLYGDMQIYGINEKGEEKLCEEKKGFIIFGARYIQLPQQREGSKKIRIIYKYKDKSNEYIILDQTLSLSFGKGFISLYANYAKLADNFPCLISDDGTEILLDIKELSKYLEFYFTEKKGIITGNLFGEKQWFELDIAKNEAKNYISKNPFGLKSYCSYWFAPADLAKLFGIDIRYSNTELALIVQSPDRFAFQIKDDMKKKIERSKLCATSNDLSPSGVGKSRCEKISSLTCKYLLGYSSYNEISSANMLFGANFSDFLFTAHQRSMSNGNNEITDRKLSYFNNERKFKINCGELNYLAQAPFEQRWIEKGAGIEISSLFSSEDRFQFPAKKFIASKKSEEYDAYFYDRAFIDQNNTTLLFKRGTNAVTHQYLTIYGDEISEDVIYPVPYSYPGHNKFSFYAGFLQDKNGDRSIYNARLNYGIGAG